MTFINCLMLQISAHKSIQAQDVVKMSYQSAFGAEHLLENIDAAKNYFYSEYESTMADNMPLYEEISPDTCRINLSAWKQSKMPPEWLFNMFVCSANFDENSIKGENLFEKYVSDAEKLAEENAFEFSGAEWREFISRYKTGGVRALHHSDIYRENERPAYRIISNKFLRLLPVLEKTALLRQKNGVNIIAIDGRAASGKSTMAKMLAEVLDCDIIHMDDFFLPMALRTRTRLSEAGGNVHYERFLGEVLPYILSGENFSYKIFDCSEMKYNGIRKINLVNKKYCIVEGAYSCHDKFGEYADLKIFSNVFEDEQMKRIIKRNGVKMAEKFRTNWIPLEEKYFESCRIKENAHIII